MFHDTGGQDFFAMFPTTAPSKKAAASMTSQPGSGGSGGMV
jgi:hypothetical protein